MLWFQKDSLDRVGFGTYGRGSRVLNQKVTFGVLNLPIWGGGATSIGQSPEFYQFLGGLRKTHILGCLGLPDPPLLFRTEF